MVGDARRVYDIALRARRTSEHGDLSYTCTETMTDLMTSSTSSPEEKNYTFYKWFSHGIDINDKGQICDREMTIDGIKEQHVRVILETTPEEGEVETIITDSGSDVSEGNTNFKTAKDGSST